MSILDCADPNIDDLRNALGRGDGLQDQEDELQGCPGCGLVILRQREDDSDQGQSFVPCSRIAFHSNLRGGFESREIQSDFLLGLEHWARFACLFILFVTLIQKCLNYNSEDNLGSNLHSSGCFKPFNQINSSQETGQALTQSTNTI